MYAVALCLGMFTSCGDDEEIAPTPNVENNNDKNDQKDEDNKDQNDNQNDDQDNDENGEENGGDEGIEHNPGVLKAFSFGGEYLTSFFPHSETNELGCYTFLSERGYYYFNGTVAGFRTDEDLILSQGGIYAGRGSNSYEISDIKCNSDGFITSLRYKEWDEVENYDFTNNYTYEGRHLTKIVSEQKYEEYGETFISNVECTLNWEDDNLTGFTSTYVDRDSNGKVVDSDKSVYTISYGTQKNPHKQYTFAICYELSTTIDEVMIGLTGDGPALLPTQILSSWENYTNCSYTLNDNGTIATEHYYTRNENWIVDYSYTGQVAKQKKIIADKNTNLILSKSHHIRKNFRK